MALFAKGFGKGSRKKDGSLNARGAARLGGKKPLIGESKTLSHDITFLADGRSVTVGSPMEYAAAQQFGAVAGAFGRTRRGAPIPFGAIPARPFLGVSSADKEDILEILRSHLLGG